VGEIRSFRDLTYLGTADFPDAERFGLVAQIGAPLQKLLYGLRREKERRLGLSAAGASLLVLLRLLHFFA
jgi:hypothetical protein